LLSLPRAVACASNLLMKNYSQPLNTSKLGD